MDSRELRLLITDLDGTLVDTQRANFLAYSQVLEPMGIELVPELYRKCFGLRLEEFMEYLGIIESETIHAVRMQKAACYPNFFSELRLNSSLLSFLRASRRSGKYIAVATTARHENLLHVLQYFGIADEFDFLLSGEDIRYSKPDPECYLEVMAHFGVHAANTLIFEDSPVGIEAARRSGASYILIDKAYYEH